MRKILLAFSFLIAFVAFSFAQKGGDTVLIVPKKKIHFGDGIYIRDSTWKFGGYAGFTLSQVALVNWGPGGVNNFAFLLNGNAYANYKKGKLIWENNLDAKWGMVANGLIRNSALASRNFQKNIDLLSFKSNFGYEIAKDLYVSAKLGFESQFSPSYDYSQTDTVGSKYRKYKVSQFFAPAVVTIGPGLTYKPKPYITIFVSPIEGKLTFVTKDDAGRDTTHNLDGSFVDRYYSDVDETRFGLKRGKSFMGELGAEIDVMFQKEIVKNVSWKSHLNVFVSYMNANYNTVMPFYYAAQDSMGSTYIRAADKHIPVVQWDNDIVFKVNKWLSATLSTRFVYQYNALVPVDKRNNITKAGGSDGYSDVDSKGLPITTFNRLQIFEQFGVALNYKF